VIIKIFGVKMIQSVRSDACCNNVVSVNMQRVGVVLMAWCAGWDRFLHYTLNFNRNKNFVY
jgi:hypothetical protein